MEKKSVFSLDTPLLSFSKDNWTIRDACEGVQVFGAIGSGKTSGSGATLARSFLSSGFGGLVMCAKPEERQLWEQYAYETNRTQHLVIFSPREPWRFNFLDYELRRVGRGAGLTENIVNLLTTVTDIVEGKQQFSGGDQFWERAMREMLRNAIDVISLAQGTITLEDIRNFIMDAPVSRVQVGDENWKNTSFCAECIAKAHRKDKNPREQHDYEVARRYFLGHWTSLGERTRSSIVATFTGVVDILLHGFAWELLATELNIVPEVTYQDGAIIVLDIPIQEYNELGRIAQGIFKYMFQRAILRRDVNEHPRPVFLWADEAQNFISSFDYQYQAVARSARACTVYMTQNISNYYAMLGAQGRDEANALLGNFQTKIFHANSDVATNQYASEIIAQDWTEKTDWGVNNGNSGGTVSVSGSQSVQYKVLPATFTVLKKGGQSNNFHVEGIVFQGGRIWNETGDTYLRCIFEQK